VVIFKVLKGVVIEVSRDSRKDFKVNSPISQNQHLTATNTTLVSYSMSS